MRVLNWVLNSLGVWIPRFNVKRKANKEKTTGKDKMPQCKLRAKTGRDAAKKTRSKDHDADLDGNGPSAAPSARVRETDEDIIEEAIEKPMFSLPMLIWATRILWVLTLCSLILASVCLIMAAWDWNGRRELTNGIVSCWRKPNKACYSNLKAAIFPLSESTNSYQLNFKLVESDLESAKPIFNVTIPLLLHNPAIWLLVMFIVFVTHQFMSSLRDSLAAAGAANAILFHETPKKEPRRPAKRLKY